MSASQLKAWCRARVAARSAAQSVRGRVQTLPELVAEANVGRGVQDEWREIERKPAGVANGWVSTFRNDAFPNLTLRQWSDGSFELRDGNEIVTPRELVK